MYLEFWVKLFLCYPSLGLLFHNVWADELVCMSVVGWCARTTSYIHRRSCTNIDMSSELPPLSSP